MKKIVFLLLAFVFGGLMVYFGMDDLVYGLSHYLTFNEFVQGEPSSIFLVTVFFLLSVICCFISLFTSDEY